MVMVGFHKLFHLNDVSVLTIKLLLCHCQSQLTFSFNNLTDTGIQAIERSLGMTKGYLLED